MARSFRSAAPSPRAAPARARTLVLVVLASTVAPAPVAPFVPAAAANGPPTSGVTGAPAAAAAACFGGVPQVIATGETNPSNLFVAGDSLYWSGWGLRQLKATAAEATTITTEMGARVLDTTQAFDIGDKNDLLAVDVRTGIVRALLGGRDRGQGAPSLSTLGLDAKYVYFSRIDGSHRRPDSSGFFRILREGGSAAEKIGAEPRFGYAPFVVADGFVYWTGETADHRSVISRRALTPGSAIATVATLRRPTIGTIIKSAGDRIYYFDDDAIWSAPVGGTGAVAHGAGVPVRHATIGGNTPTDLIVEPGCLYWADGRTIRRAQLTATGGRSPEIVDDELTYFGGTLATDGNFLYWADARGGRILRAGRDPRPSPARGALLAHPAGNDPAPRAVIDAPEGSPPATALAIGDGWGCARVRVRGEIAWQCWNAAPLGRTPPKIVARTVPWLDSPALVAGPDRVCGQLAGRARCWTWPDFTRRRPADFPATRTAWDPAPDLRVGGTFACASSRGAWSCFGDDSFGQLGEGRPGVTPFGEAGALGTWHGCTLQGPSEIHCWGRGDLGQLGFAATDTCRLGREIIPCSRTPRKVPFGRSGAVLVAGDLFTCAVGHPLGPQAGQMSQSGQPGPTSQLAEEGLTCWGANRDGFFGTADDCPAHLRESWPTRAGPTAAPKAACAAAPASVIGFEHARTDLSVGPRGVCAVVDVAGHVRCAGAVVTPALDVRGLHVSPGDQPSACGLVAASVVCWGAGYSPPGDPRAPSVIAFDDAPNPAAAVVDNAPRNGVAWAGGCRVHEGCPHATPALRPCPPGATGEPWSALVPKAASLLGRPVRVRDRLSVGRIAGGGPLTDFRTPTRTCGRGECCNLESRPLVLGAGPDPLYLRDLGCSGDDSRLCCNAPAFGQSVIVTGSLTRVGGRDWTVVAPEVCADGG